MCQIYSKDKNKVDLLSVVSLNILMIRLLKFSKIILI